MAGPLPTIGDSFAQDPALDRGPVDDWSSQIFKKEHIAGCPIAILLCYKVGFLLLLPSICHPPRICQEWDMGSFQRVLFDRSGSSRSCQVTTSWLVGSEKNLFVLNIFYIPT